MMRIKGEKYETIRAGMKAAIIDLGGVDVIKTRYKGLSWTRLLFDVWYVSMRNLPGFDPYTNGDNDDHIETALRKIGRETGLISA